MNALSPLPLFDGATFEPKRDEGRLKIQLAKVRRAMWDGRWHTLDELAAAADAPQASVSARIRDLRKPKFGAYKVERRHVKGGLFEYRINFIGGAR